MYMKYSKQRKNNENYKLYINAKQFACCSKQMTHKVIVFCTKPKWKTHSHCVNSPHEMNIRVAYSSVSKTITCFIH